jgi:hypothetical protein
VINRLIAPSVLVAVTSLPMVALAQGAFPPLPGQSSTLEPSPPGAAKSAECMKGFVPLQEDAAKKGKLIKAAAYRHASLEEACKLFGSYSAAEIEMIQYVEANALQCAIPARIAEVLNAAHKNTERVQNKVCDMAQQVKTRGTVGPSLNEVLGLSQATVRRQGPTGDFGDPVRGSDFGDPTYSTLPR